MESILQLKSKDAQRRIVKSIEEAELNTSGEIRIHIESYCKGDPYLRAAYIFTKLNMHNTKQRNGVLIYIAYKSHCFAIIGDSGINEKVAPDFWNNVKEQMGNDFSKGQFLDGICTAIKSAGNNLKEFFPYTSDDINEQTNEISYGD